MNTRYQIGEFAKLGGVSAKTLRFYDEIGLLRPASVDPRTGYRHYLPLQLEELASILALKNLGMSLAKVRELTAKRGSAADRRAILNELKGTIEQSIQTATRGVLWHRCADSGSLEAEPFIALRRIITARFPFEQRRLPEATLACAYSSLDDESAEQSYTALRRWMNVRGYRLAGPKRELYLGQMLEIQFPFVEN